MSSIQIVGNKFLKGTVRIGGSKNAAIPLICGSLLAKGKVLLRNVPRINDVFDLINILKNLDCNVKFKGHMLLIDNSKLKYKPLFFEECSKIRGSYYLIGVFLTLFSKCEIVLPGGCKIGKRPIDLHLKAFEELGYAYEIVEDKLYLTKRKDVKETKIIFEKKSVGASINALFAGLSLDKVVIENVLYEPEGLDVIKFLQEIGYDLQLDEDKLIYNKGKLEFRFVKHYIIPDRIEAMTYTILGLLTGKMIIQNVNLKDIELPLKMLKDAGYDIIYNDCEIKALKSLGGPLNIKTDIYPGFPTDLQSIFGVLSAFSLGESIIEETIFENRFQIYQDLAKLNSNVKINKNVVNVIGTDNLQSGEFNVCDLRHGAAVILLSLKLNGKSIIHNYELVERGYEDFIKNIIHFGGEVEHIKMPKEYKNLY